MARLKDMYKEQVAPALMKQFAYSSPMQIPRFDKIVINIGAGDAKENSKVIDNIIRDLTITAGHCHGCECRSSGQSKRKCREVRNGRTDFLAVVGRA